MLALLFVITFIESLGSTLLQRGIYFYTHEVGHFSQTQNLWFALGYGVIYILGALASHPIVHRIGERRLLVTSLLGLLLAHTLLGSVHSSRVLVVGALIAAGLQGLKWPVVESYLSAGRSPRELLPVLSRFNVTWAVAGSLAVGAAGLVIRGHSSALFFGIPAVINALALLLATRLPAAPTHRTPSEPAPGSNAAPARMRVLLSSARWSMISSYALLFVLAPLLPTLFERLQLPVAHATLVAAVFDVVRLFTFAAAGAFTAWHGRSYPLWLAMLGLPLGFASILLGNSLGVVIFGQVLFGVAAAFAYTAALYYALVSKNASVDAGGAHESLIGLGLGLGPLAGLVGQGLAGLNLPAATGGGTLGTVPSLLVALSPVLIVCAGGSLSALVKLRGRSS